MKVSGFRCDKCGLLHDEKSKNFYTVRGNINLGLSDGLVGNNINEKTKEVLESHYCISCLAKIMGLTEVHQRMDT